MYKLRVFIGRFQCGIHNGHVNTIKSISDSDRILVLIGSSYRSRSIKNPFSYSERRSIIRSWWDAIPRSTVLDILPLEDNPYNDNEWIANVQSTISAYVHSQGLTNFQIEIVCSDKEDSKSYPHWFPGYQKKIIPALSFENGDIISATAVRDDYYKVGANCLDKWNEFTIKYGNYLPYETISFLYNFLITDAYQNLYEENKFVEEYKKSWSVAPYPPIFVTTDAIVVQSGHVALIQRRDSPGKGYWALPGGFLNPEERIQDGCIRELREETGIKVPVPVLEGSILRNQVFDKPDRSSRGRTITHAFYIKLKDELELPHIKGCDDAIKAKWIPLSELYEEFHLILLL